MKLKIITLVIIREMKERLEYNPTTGALKWKLNNRNGIKKGAECRTVTTSGHIVMRFNQQLYLAHRVIWAIYYGETPPDSIDHINRDRTDNRISNLRKASSSENSCNIPRLKNNTSGHKGVNWDKRRGRWRARVRFCGATAEKLTRDIDVAVEWAVQKRKELHGDFHCNG